MPTSSSPLVLSTLPGRYAVCRMGPSASVPAWAGGESLFSTTRTPEELSMVCEEASVPAEVTAERGWAALKLHGPIPFGTTGVLASLTAPLAEAGIPVFALSTFDTDYLLVKAATLAEAVSTLRAAGFDVRGDHEGIRSLPSV